jgi:small conductance mechanosensitive channel
LLIVVVSFLAWLTLNSWIDYRIEPTSRRSAAVRARERTLLILVRNAATIAIIVFAGMFVLSEIGLNIAPLLASAGVIGLAIGFGAQKLVQDIITGIFIQMEGAIDVGDGVTIGGISGSVERLTIRSAGLRDLHGNYHIVPFSSVSIVTNSNRGFSYAVFELAVDYREDVVAVREAMEEAFAEVHADPALAADFLTDQLEWMGIIGFAGNAMTVRARIKTRPSKQGGVTRVYNDTIKRIFAERGIRTPLPQAVYLGAEETPAALEAPAETPAKRSPARRKPRAAAAKPPARKAD